MTSPFDPAERSKWGPASRRIAAVAAGVLIVALLVGWRVAREAARVRATPISSWGIAAAGDGSESSSQGSGENASFAPLTAEAPSPEAPAAANTAALSAPRSADCAIVLTGGPGRVREGFDLLARKLAQKLIVSGVHPQAELREIFPLWPFYGSVRPEDVALERRSRTTFGNAQQSLPLVEALHCRDAWLVTSRVHMYRALKTFRAEFPPTLRLYPRAVVSGSAEPSWGDIASETAKSLFYSLWAY